MADEWDDAASAAYVESLFYAKDSPAQKRQLQLVLQHLNFEPESRFVDIGAGNGDFTAVVAAAAGLSKQALGVEPASAMVGMHSEAPSKVSLLNSPAVDFVELSALSGAAADAWPATWEGGAGSKPEYDRVLMKEVVHLFGDSPARGRVFHGIYNQMAVGGTVCVFTRPREPKYPFPPKAMALWGGHDTGEYVKELAAAGFEVTIVRDSQKLEMPREAWLGLLKGRVWSVYSKANFDEAGLADLVVETDALMTEQYGSADPFLMDEEYVIITGVKR